MSEKSEAIERFMRKYRQHFEDKMRLYPPDPRKDILADLVDRLCGAINCHARLVIAEREGRFLLSQDDYHSLLEDYLAAFREVKTLPRERPRSIYEITLISSLDTIVKSHCEGEEIE
jgi:hypothetical protein